MCSASAASSHSSWRSSGSSPSIVPTWRFTATIRCPELYGNEFSTRKARERRVTMPRARSSPGPLSLQKRQPRTFSARFTYAMRQPANMRSIRAAADPSEPPLRGQRRVGGLGLLELIERVDSERLARVVGLEHGDAPSSFPEQRDHVG